MQIKKRWLGDDCHINGPAGNDISRSNLPNIRASFRYQTLMEERIMVLSALRDIDSVDDLAPESPLFSEPTSSMTNPSIFQSPKLNLAAEPMFSLSPKRNLSFSAEKSGPFKSLGAPAMPLIQGEDLFNFPGVSILTERRARGTASHDGEESHAYFQDDFDEIFE